MNWNAPVSRDVLQARTAAHYDRHPLEFLTLEDERDIASAQPTPFLRYVATYVPAGAAVAEIGCGPGRATMYLASLGHNVLALDISQSSLALARKRAPAARFVQGTNLSLPLRDESFGAVVSDGVIHHTPDARQSFGELARICTPGGALYLGVYGTHSLYHRIYGIGGPPVRWLERHALGRWFILCTLVPAYWAVHLVRTRGRRSWRGAMNFFWDYLLTPQASFHSFEEVCAWASQEGLQLLEYDGHSLRNVHVFVFGKTGRRLGTTGATC